MSDYQHQGWLGEPYASDFQASWGLIRHDEMFDGTDIDRTCYAADAAIKAGFKYVIVKRPSTHDNRLYIAQGMKCVVGLVKQHERRAVKVREAYRNDPKFRLKQLVAVARTRATQRGLPFDLDAEDIYQRASKGRCEATGIILDLKNVGDAELRNPFSPSLDQVDPGKGYTKDNVQVVCWGWNLMKSNFPPHMLERFLQALFSHNGAVG